MYVLCDTYVITFCFCYAARTVPVTTILFQNMEAALPSNVYVTPSQYQNRNVDDILHTYMYIAAKVKQLYMHMLLDSRAVGYNM